MKKNNPHRATITAEYLQERNVVVILEDPINLDCGPVGEDGKRIIRECERGWMGRVFPHAVLWFFVGLATGAPSGLLNDLFQSMGIG